jgi:predicted DNA-binding helix-hairpin-helix protein
MLQIRQGIAETKLVPRIGWGLSARKASRFVPAGQTTQMIVGASPESDFQILRLASHLYGKEQLKRVYYSGYVPVNADRRLPVVQAVPLRRENRLYQADWLMRFYNFRYDEILDESTPHLDPDLDPKLSWALRNPAVFPLDLDRADYEMILRVPGIGVRSARLIVQGRRFGHIRLEHLKRMGVALNRAKYFIVNPDLPRSLQRLYPEQIRRALVPTPKPQQTFLFEHSSQILLPGALAS